MHILKISLIYLTLLLNSFQLYLHQKTDHLLQQCCQEHIIYNLDLKKLSPKEEENVQYLHSFKNAEKI